MFLQALRDDIIASFNTLGKEKFVRTAWEHAGGGGGEMSVARGDTFEKAAVNWSGVYGDVFPGQDGRGPFFATGVSLITHMKNPHAPTAHMNIRYIETEDQVWFGGGYDLTPMGVFYEEDREHFHRVAKCTLDQHDKTLYPRFSAAAKEYFFIKHRKKERGVGGIFFDHENDREVWQAVGQSFLAAIMPIYERRIAMPYTEEQKQLQLAMRAHYVEFNLLYDRGTKFGFLSGGNPEAILCSMPPVATW